jgi:predicted kinase
MYHPFERLSEGEVDKYIKYIGKTFSWDNGGQKPLLICMVGLVGSGKSTVAREIARALNAIVIENNEIRVEFNYPRENGRDMTRLIAEMAACEVVREGGIAVLDSDFIDPRKRASLRAKVRGLGVEIVYVRTFTDLEVMFSRIMNASYPSNELFGQRGGAPRKISECARRLPLHYYQRRKGRGRWTLRRLPFEVLAEIDTGVDDSEFHTAIAALVEKIRGLIR